MKIGTLITAALQLADKVRDIPNLSEEAENEIFKHVGKIVQTVVNDLTS